MYALSFTLLRLWLSSTRIARRGPLCIWLVSKSEMGGPFVLFLVENCACLCRSGGLDVECPDGEISRDLDIRGVCCRRHVCVG